jgi:Skp family chaperone for outer membrane proteins
MNRFRFLTAFLFINAFLVVSAMAQAAAPKIAFIDTDAFYDEKVGITKLVNANKQLNTEFAARIKELEDGNTKLQGIAAELQTMQKLPQSQFNQVAFNTKQDEGERLQRELNYKKTDVETAITSRRTALITPISQDISKAMDEYAKKNGYGVILDIGKFADAGAVLFFAEAADATKDFINFYNARPATAATPK